MLGARNLVKPRPFPHFRHCGSITTNTKVLPQRQHLPTFSCSCWFQPLRPKIQIGTSACFPFRHFMHAIIVEFQKGGSIEPLEPPPWVWACFLAPRNQFWGLCSYNLQADIQYYNTLINPGIRLANLHKYGS
jgi:hypothetical protein